MKKSLKVIGAKRVIRCSSLPRLFDCPSSVLNPDKLTEVRVINGAENLGTDIHAALQRTVETGETDFGKIERLYKGEDVERAKALYFNGLAVIQTAKQDMKNPQFEVEVSFETAKYSVTGHIDMVDLHPDRAYVVDFKTGRTRDDHYHQMVGYAVGAWTKMGRPSVFTVHVAYAYLEDRSDITSFDLSVRDMQEWLKELDGLSATLYQVNRRCIYCPLQNDCKTFRSYLTGAVSLLRKTAGEDDLVLPKGGIRKLAPKLMAELAVAAKHSDTMVKRWRDAVKAEATERGPIPTGNGNKYEIKLFKSRVLITEKAMPVLAKYVTAKALVRATHLDLNDLIGDAVRHAKGAMKGILRKEIEAKLDKAGAIVYNYSPRLETTNEKGTRVWPTKKKK